LGLAAGDGHLWVTATDAGEILRIDPATGVIARAHVGGSPLGIAVTAGQVWFAGPPTATSSRRPAFAAADR
jgi:streptogramin lyase